MDSFAIWPRTTRSSPTTSIAYGDHDPAENPSTSSHETPSSDVASLLVGSVCPLGSDARTMPMRPSPHRVIAPTYRSLISPGVHSVPSSDRQGRW